ncbi:MAG: hypothetical protein K0R70_2054, partial [Steroidobacteraceae bacterium]|nr:hypothetical protein [Steroidobacteraceae bacterium]
MNRANQFLLVMILSAGFPGSPAQAQEQ